VLGFPTELEALPCISPGGHDSGSFQVCQDGTNGSNGYVEGVGQRVRVHSAFAVAERARKPRGDGDPKHLARRRPRLFAPTGASDPSEVLMRERKLGPEQNDHPGEVDPDEE
jgi:hypothetical protein